jgi:UDP-2,3-diacylglucosamine hydrolase
MRAIFLSDTHLKNSHSTRYRDLIRFLDAIANDVSHLIIVGDFFDFWFCSEDAIYPEFKQIIDTLLHLVHKGVDVSMLEGNHDFFLDEFFGKFGVKVFPDNAAIDLGDKKVYVSHGDTVDTTNTAYLMLRRVLRSKVFHITQKNVPSSLLWKIARLSSKTSRDYLARPQDGLVRIMSDFSRRKFNEGFDAVVLGHCHQPVLERHRYNDTDKTFVILGDWVNYYSYLQFQGGIFTLSYYRP